MNLGAEPAVVRGHDRLRAGGDGGAVASGMHVAQDLLGAGGIALVSPAGRVAFADEMLGGRQHATRTEEVVLAHRALQPRDHPGREIGNEVRMLGVAFVGSSPAVVAHDRERGCERPVDPRGCHLARRRAGDRFR